MRTLLWSHRTNIIFRVWRATWIHKGKATGVCDESLSETDWISLSMNHRQLLFSEFSVVSDKVMKSMSSLSMSSQARLGLKLSGALILLFLAFSTLSTYFEVGFVAIPPHCVKSCPPNHNRPDRFVCARKIATGELGMFRSTCFLSRYNYCVSVHHKDRKLNWNIYFLICFNICLKISGYEHIHHGFCTQDDLWYLMSQHKVILLSKFSIQNLIE